MSNNLLVLNDLMTRKKYCEDNDLCFISMTECDPGTCFETVIHPEIGKVKVRAKYKNAVNLLIKK